MRFLLKPIDRPTYTQLLAWMETVGIRVVHADREGLIVTAETKDASFRDKLAHRFHYGVAVTEDLPLDSREQMASVEDSAFGLEAIHADELYDVPTVAAVLHMPVTDVQRLCQSGELETSNEKWDVYVKGDSVLSHAAKTGELS